MRIIRFLLASSMLGAVLFHLFNQFFMMILFGISLFITPLGTFFAGTVSFLDRPDIVLIYQIIYFIYYFVIGIPLISLFMFLYRKKQMNGIRMRFLG